MTRSHYADLIGAAIGTTDDATVALVEELMRTDRSGLDGLTRLEFIAAARRGYADARELATLGALAEYCDALQLTMPRI